MTGPIKFSDEQYAFPKPLIDINGKTMFENALAPLKELDDIEIFTVINESDANEFSLDQVLKRSTEGLKSSVRLVKKKTAGALCTTLLLSDYLEDDELIISNYDHHLGFNVTDAVEYFKSENAHFGVISFDSVHPKWSYVRLDEAGSIIESAEKYPISRHALVGLYYFKSSNSYISAAKTTILSASSDQKVFYISEVINALVLEGFKGSCYKINKNEYQNFYDSSELKDFNETAVSQRYIQQELLVSTLSYIQAFDAKDIKTVSRLLADDSTLYDPSVGKVIGKPAILEFVSKLFDSHIDLNFLARKVLIDKNYSVIEFILTLDTKIVQGVDIITWQNGKILAIDAYLEIK